MGDNLSGQAAINILKWGILQLFKLYIFWSVIDFLTTLFYYKKNFYLLVPIKLFLYTVNNN